MLHNISANIDHILLQVDGNQALQDLVEYSFQSLVISHFDEP